MGPREETTQTSDYVPHQVYVGRSKLTGSAPRRGRVGRALGGLLVIAILILHCGIHLGNTRPAA